MSRARRRLIGTVAVGVAAVLLAACSSGSTPAARHGTATPSASSSSSASSSVPAFTIAQLTSPTGQPEVLVRPRGTVRGLVVFMHGLGADQDQIAQMPQLEAVGDELVQAGYAIVASYAHGDNFGNPISVKDQRLAVADARARLGGVRQVDILAFSMGGLDALLTAASHRIEGLHALALISPATDQRSFTTGQFAQRLSAAYGDPGPSRLRADLDRSDPMLQPASHYAGYAYRFWHSPDDTTVPVAQSLSMSRHLARAGILADVSPLTGDHGDLSRLDPDDVLQLFESSTT